MFRSQRLQNWLDVTRSGKDRRRPAARSRRLVRLVLESLEDRLTPSTVTQSAGSYTTLSGLVAGDTAANTNYVINITNSFTFGAGGQVSISKLGTGSTLTIQGQNGTNYTLSGNGNRFFDVEGKSQTVTLANLTLTSGGGKAVSQGGAIEDVGGRVSLNGVTVNKNSVVGTASTPARGGGVFVSGGGSLSLTNTLIANNSAIGSAAGQEADGGGVSVVGSSTVTITDSTLSGNTATGAAGAASMKAGENGQNGGFANGGGLFISGSGWTATLKGDTLSSNAAFGGVGGKGATGSYGGEGGSAYGGGLYVDGGGGLTILNDLAAPLTHPSIMINNSLRAGTGGAGATGGYGGSGGTARGGALHLQSDYGQTLTANIGNTTFYVNAVYGGNPGSGGTGDYTEGGFASGGGLDLWIGSGAFTMINSTVASNYVWASVLGKAVGSAHGGGIYNFGSAVTLDNNTIIVNNVDGQIPAGGGIYNAYGDLTLFNNLIQGNGVPNTTGADLYTTSSLFWTARNNFITYIVPTNAVNTATNIVGNDTLQSGPVMGVDSNGNPSGGPIYYPLFSGVASIGAGTTNVIPTISGIEGNIQPTDEIGGHRTSNGSISLGAVQPLVPDPTTVVPGNASVNYFGATASPALQIAAAVNDTLGGTVSGGSLSFSLIANNTTKLLGKATVGANGIAMLNVPAGTLPANLKVGTYELIESYAGNAFYLANDAIGTLSVTTAPTTVVAGNAVIGIGGGKTTIPVVVNSPTGVVSNGTATIKLVNGTTTSVVGSAAVSGGSASVIVTIPKLPTSSYQLVETYSDSTGHFAGSSAIGTLTVDPPSSSEGSSAINTPTVESPPPLSPQAAALELAIDAAALALQNNPAALMELEMFSEAFLHYAIPATIPELIGSIQSLDPQTSGLSMSAIGAGMSLAQNLQQKNL